MRRKSIYTIALFLIFALVAILSNINSVNVKNNESVIKGIERYKETSVNQIILTKFDEDEYFVLYDDLEGNLSLCIFEKKELSFGRYYFTSGGSSGGEPGDFIFSESTSEGYRQLSVAYGRTSNLTNGTFRVILENDELIIKPMEEFYLEIYREETKKSRMIGFDYS